jgi:hypothetical protein
MEITGISQERRCESYNKITFYFRYFTLYFRIYYRVLCNKPFRYTEDAHRIKTINKGLIAVSVIGLCFMGRTGGVVANIVAENTRLEKSLAQIEIIKKMPADYQLVALVDMPINQLGQIPTGRQ